jgi:hypothetical protein
MNALPQQSEDFDTPFESFRALPDIVAALSDKRLQAIITQIDSSQHREGELVSQIELNPEFASFVDRLLKAAPPSIIP